MKPKKRGASAGGWLAALFIVLVPAFGCNQRAGQSTKAEITVSISSAASVYSEVHADILMDGAMVGSVERMAPVKLSVPTGQHAFRAISKGYKPVEKVVEILATGGVQPIHFSLEP